MRTGRLAEKSVFKVEKKEREKGGGRRGRGSCHERKQETGVKV